MFGMNNVIVSSLLNNARFGICFLYSDCLLVCHCVSRTVLTKSAIYLPRSEKKERAGWLIHRLSLLLKWAVWSLKVINFSSQWDRMKEDTNHWIGLKYFVFGLLTTGLMYISEYRMVTMGGTCYGWKRQRSHPICSLSHHRKASNTVNSNWSMKTN